MHYLVYKYIGIYRFHEIQYFDDNDKSMHSKQTIESSKNGYSYNICTWKIINTCIWLKVTAERLHKMYLSMLIKM